MRAKLEQITAEAIREIQNSDGLAKLNDVRVAFLGKKGELTAFFKINYLLKPKNTTRGGNLLYYYTKKIYILIF